MLGIASLPLACGCLGLGIVPAVISLALASGARREITASGGSLTGTGLVTAGVVGSWISVAIGVLVILWIAFS